MKRILMLLIFGCLVNATFAKTQDSIDLETYLHQNNIQTTVITDGLHYQIEKEGHGASPTMGDYVLVNYVGKLLNGNTFDESGEEPFIFQLGYRQVIRGWEQGIPLFKVGSKGKLFISSHLGYGKVGAGKVIPPNSALIYDIEVLRVMDYDAYDRYMADLEERERIAFEKEQKDQFSKDKKLIHEYARDKKLKTKRLPSGVSYSLKKKGKGSMPQEGDIIFFHYEGFLLDGTRFDSSYEKKNPFSFPLGKGKAIKGLEDGLRYFKKGAEGWILVPSKLAYGPMEIDDDGVQIPANSVLAFKVKVLKIERKK